jgi:hypothetical protein
MFRSIGDSSYVFGMSDNTEFGEIPCGGKFKANLAQSVLFPKRLGYASELASMVLIGDSSRRGLSGDGAPDGFVLPHICRPCGLSLILELPCADRRMEICG